MAKRFESFLSLVALCALNGCEREAATAPGDAPPIAKAPVVYGEDGRTDWYAIDDAKLKLQAHDSVAAMIEWDFLSTNADGSIDVDGDPPLGVVEGLCADQRFRDQPTAAECSGTLIGEDLILTAGHCETTLADCASTAWVFDYLYEADGQLAKVSADSVYRCVDLVVQPGVDLPDDIDLAIVQLDRPVHGRVPAAVAPPAATLSRGSQVIMAGFPSGIPLKVDPGGLVADARTQQKDYFVASVDAFAGNSGSGVLDSALAVRGVLVTGADDYANAGSCNVVATLDPDAAEEDVMYAFHAVKSACDRGYPSDWLCPGGEAASCGDGWCTGSEAADGCSADCDGLFAVPPAWTCNAGWYDAGDDCDCGCGAYDPDCDNHDLDVLNCAPGSSCNRDGTCHVPIPEGWVCSPDQYGEGNRCNCGCGVPDPDCADKSLTVNGCAPGGTCQEDGTCTVAIADGWDCRRRFYGSGDGCDCDCGAFDPDCADPAQQVFGCVPGTACNADGTCAVPLPAGWICGSETYGAGDECDCNCGAPDPDCDGTRAVRNCGSAETCSADGACVAGSVEPEPDAGPEAVEVVEEVVVEEVVEPVAEEVVAEKDDDVAEGDAVDAAADATPDASDAADTRDAGDSADAAVEGHTGGKHDSGCAGGGADGLGLSAALAMVGLVVLRRRRSVA